MRRVLVDINVVLDVLLARRPGAGGSAGFWSEAEGGSIVALLPAHAFTTVHYLVGREKGKAVADGVVKDLLSVFRVAPVSAAVLEDAASRGWADFEDAVTACSGIASRCEAIVTRDVSGFRKSPLPVVTPEEASALIHAGGGRMKGRPGSRRRSGSPASKA